MDVNVAVTARLELLGGHEELLVEFLVQFVENKAPLGGNKRGICVGVLLVTDVHDGLALLVHLVQHAYKVLLVVAVVLVALCNVRICGLQSALNYVVHLGDGDFVRVERLCLLGDVAADIFDLSGGKLVHHAGGGLIYRVHHLLDIEFFLCIVLFYYPDH